MAAIEFDFWKAKAQAELLDRLASQLEKLANVKMQDTLSGISEGWSGESARLYLEKGRLLTENLQQTSRYLRNMAQTVRSVASAMKEAEERAKQIALERSYK